MMTTPAISCRLRPELAAHIDESVRSGSAKDKTEVIERALCDRFEIKYEPIIAKRSKGARQQ